jgi:Ser/Thr protein kinase RdoA (MazF antagonist)
MINFSNQIGKYWKENYEHIGNIKKIEEFNHNVNSWNFTIYTNNGKFLLRRILDGSKKSKMETICNILINCKNKQIKVLEPIKNKQNEYVNNTPIFYLTKFYTGKFFSNTLNEIKESAENIAKLHKVLSKNKIKYKYKPDSSKYYTIISKKEIDNISDKIKDNPKVELNKKIQSKLLFLIDKIDEINKTSPKNNLKFSNQLIHGDLHPENMIFKNSQLVTILDFNDMQFTKIIKEISFSCIRFSMYNTDNKKLMNNRVEKFLETYHQFNKLNLNEIFYLKYFFQKETLQRISYLLRLRFQKESEIWKSEILKQIKFLEDSEELNISKIIKQLKI